MVPNIFRVAPVLLTLAACTGAPGRPTVELGPEGATTTDDLVLTITDHPDVKEKQGVTYQVTWYRDDNEIEELADQTTLPSTETTKGQTWRAVVLPVDKKFQQGFAADASLTIANTPPSLSSVSLSHTAPSRADTLVATAEGMADMDEDLVSLTFSWSANGSVVKTETVSDGQSELPGDPYLGVGDVIFVTVTPNDGSVDGEPVVSAEVTVVNAPPTISTLRIEPEPLYGNNVASAVVEVSDSDGDDVETRFAWSVNGTEVATSATLVPTWFTKGDTVSLAVTADDGADTTTETVEVTVQNRPPGAPEISINPTDPGSDDDLICTIDTPATDADGDELSYSVTWFVDGTEWGGATGTTTWAGDTISGSDTKDEEEWVCFATAFDGAESGPDAESASVVVNDLPAVGFESSVGVISGSNWRVCRADSSTAWLAANTTGTYNAVTACNSIGYSTVDSQGGTCGTVCGYCGTIGREYYDGGGGSTTSLRYTVHWRCAR